MDANCSLSVLRDSFVSLVCKDFERHFTPFDFAQGRRGHESCTKGSKTYQFDPRNPQLTRLKLAGRTVAATWPVVTDTVFARRCHAYDEMGWDVCLLKNRPKISWPLIALGFVLAVLFFAAQWYLYNATHGGAERFIYYVWGCGYMLAVLAPAALRLAWRFPITSSSWRRNLPVHILASLLLTGVQVLLQAAFGWIRCRLPWQSSPSGEMTWAFALHHYFTHIEQVSLLTYWLLVAAALFYRTREEARESTLRSARLEAQLSAARLEMLGRQLHPHFLFNTLQAATTLVHDDPDRAEEVLLRLSDLLRVSLDESDQEIPLERELEILDNYVAIQTCRFGDRLQFRVSVDPEALACSVPTLLLQPLVENAVRHGIGTHKENDTITLEARRHGGALRLSISNLTSTLKKPAAQLFGQGVGLPTTRDRLGQLYGTEAAFVLRELEPKGVCAEITIPFRIVRVGDGAVTAEVAR